MARRAAAKGTPRIGLALSGGGARGLAHVPVLEALDEIGLRPSVVAGTSIGAIMGAGYASGMTGRDIRDYALGLFANRSEVLSRLWSLRPRSMRDLLAEGTFGIGQADAQRTLDSFLPPGIARDFAGLTLPLRVVATDFYGWKEAVFSDGPLFPALAASIALPVIFRPVTIEGRVMVDGGITNPLPFDHLSGCTIVIGVDVLGGPTEKPPRRGGRSPLPSPTEVLFGSTQLFMQSITTEKMQRLKPPDILLRPPARSYRVLDFLSAAQIMADAEPVKDALKRKLTALLG
jgi:NTE family protein